MDFTKALMDALTQQPFIAVLLLFGAGAISAFGPCGAQRILGLIACTTQRKTLSTSFFYTCGIALASVILLASTMVLRRIVANTHLTNILMATVCLSLGIISLWRADARSCHHRTEHLGMTAFSTFALGFGSSLLIAPCCTPFLFLIAAYAPAKLLVFDALAYGCGSALPYLIAGVFHPQYCSAFHAP